MKVLIKGAGDLATGVAVECRKLDMDVIMTEIPKPLTVRRQVSFSNAVFEKEVIVEGIKGCLVDNYEQACAELKMGNVAVVVDPDAKILKEFEADVLVDGIMAKKNIGTTMEDASCVIALGPGFYAGKDCHAVIETQRGATLGCAIYDGRAIKNTGVPGVIGGYAIERLIKASADGEMQAVAHIGDSVKKGDILALTGGKAVYAQIDGIIRGMLHDGLEVSEGMKIGDVDPRNDSSLVYMVSDKSRKIGLGVVQAIEKILYKDMGIVLLAAGRSVRYGSNKLLEVIQQKPMYQHVADLCAGIDGPEKIIVTRFPDIIHYAEEHQFLVAENEEPERGISYSMQCGLKKCLDEHENIKGILFSVCDQPYMEKDTFRRILGKAYSSPDKIVCAGKGERYGNPVYFPNRFFTELFMLTGDQGGSQIFKRYPEQILVCQTQEKELQDIDNT